MTVKAGPDFGELNIEFKQGETWTLELVLCDSARVALDLSTGYTAALQARKFVNDTAPAINLANGTGITLQAGTNNDADPNACVPNVICTLNDEATAALAAGMLRYDLFIEQTSGDANNCWLEGKIIVVGAVTRG
jgi:hypothetical protein